MKTLIIGETTNNELSSGTLEIVSKAIDLNLDFTVITVGNSDPSNIGSNDFSNIYFKLNTNKLNLSNCADEIKTFVEKNEIKLVLSNSSYIDGLLDGMTIKYDERGMIIYSIDFSKGRKHGQEIFYHINGQKKSQVYYENDKEVSKKIRWDLNGKVIP